MTTQHPSEAHTHETDVDAEAENERECFAIAPFGEAPGPRLKALTWAGAMREIENILSWNITHEDTFVIFIVASRKNRYVQARGTNAQVFVETTGDQHTEGEPYDLNDHIHLVRLGWLPASVGNGTPNWWREADPRWFYAQPVMAEMLVRTLVEVHGARSPGDITVEHGSFE